MGSHFLHSVGSLRTTGLSSSLGCPLSLLTLSGVSWNDRVVLKPLQHRFLLKSLSPSHLSSQQVSWKPQPSLLPFPDSSCDLGKGHFSCTLTVPWGFTASPTSSHTYFRGHSQVLDSDQEPLGQLTYNRISEKDPNMVAPASSTPSQGTKPQRLRKKAQFPQTQKAGRDAACHCLGCHIQSKYIL